MLASLSPQVTLENVHHWQSISREIDFKHIIGKIGQVFKKITSKYHLSEADYQTKMAPYANDKLVMKWNAEWDRGNAEGWAKGPYAAWENNEWNGKVPGGSGDVWHYKIVWIGPCTDGTSLSNGRYCIWGQFAVLMDQGTSGNLHTWFAKALPGGYGSYR